MFKYDNPVFTTLNKIADCCFLSVLWLVFSLPVVTLGASSTALYFAVVKVVRGEQGHVWQQFYDAFRENWKQASTVYAVFLGILALLGLATWASYCLAPTNALMGIVCVALVLLLNMALIVAVFAQAYTARFIFPTKVILKNSALICWINLGWSLLLWLLLFLAVQLLLFMPVAILVLPAPLALVASFILERVFRKYMSDEDWLADTENKRTEPRGR